MNTRELAGLIWLGVLVAVALVRPEGRAAIRQLLRAFFDKRILLVSAAYATFLASVVVIAHCVGLWNRSLFSETLLWLLVSGFPLLLTVTEAAKDRKFFRRAIRSEIGIAAMFVFFVNLAVFSLFWELLLQALLFMLVGASMLANMDKKYSRVRPVMTIMLTGTILLLTLHTTLQLIRRGTETDWESITLSFLLTVWLPAATVLFLVPLAYFMEYDSAFSWMKAGSDKRPPSALDKVALVIALNVHLYDLNKFRPYWGTQIKNAPSLKGKIREARRFREQLRQQRDKKESEEIELLANSGVTGTDERGGQLDKREFKETQDALRWVAICQMGHFSQRQGSYNPDIMVVLSDLTQYGLSEDHGITVKVSADGMAWYGWRKTITGWVFAIGAAADPPDEWLYDGPESPSGFPSEAAGWDHFAPGRFSRNWR